MKRALIFLLLLCLCPAAFAETILWEDDAGKVMVGDSGEVRFVAPDGSVTDLYTIGETPAPEETPEPPEAPDGGGPADAAPEPGGFVYRRALRYSDSGDAVRDLQQRLKDLGYYDARVSGGYYRVTQTAVKKFQQMNGLKSDGVAGRETQALLFSEAAVPAWATPVPTATPEPMPYVLRVDVTNQITRAYTYDETGAYTVLVREMICSTGTQKNPTPLGEFTMPRARARWGYFPTWDSHAQYLTRIDSANAFHSVLYTEPNELALAESSYRALGTRQSHGCVRLLVSDAKWIYDNCKAGTKITVYESGDYDPEYTMTLKPPLNRETMRERSLPAPTPTPEYSRAAWPKKYRTLSRGKSGTDVFLVQMRLAELGYYRGTITGGYYGGTIEAVKAFQKDHGLKVDGAAGKQTQALLFSEAADPTPAPTPEPTPTPRPTPSPDPVYRTPGPEFVG